MSWRKDAWNTSCSKNSCNGNDFKQRIKKFTKDGDLLQGFSLDWSDVLNDGDCQSGVIIDSQWLVTVCYPDNPDVNEPTLVIEGDAICGDCTSVSFTGGTNGVVYLLCNTITYRGNCGTPDMQQKHCVKINIKNTECC